MNDSTPAAGPDEKTSALFAQMVMQQTNMALMLLGKIANPNTGETMRDTEAAQYFIEQLEMLKEKTRGNLSREEAALLQQSLMTLRMTFVEAVNHPTATEPAGTPAVTPESKTAAAAEADAAAEKKFSKKY
jgi:hypothetical protein